MPTQLRFHLAGPFPPHPYEHTTAMRAVLYGWFRQADPALGRALHSGLWRPAHASSRPAPARGSAPRPITLSPLWHDPAAPDECWIDLALLDDELEAPLREGIRRAGDALSLGDRQFRLRSVEPRRRAGWHELCEPVPDLRRLTIRLETPTAHHVTGSRGKYLVLPSPEAYFRSWQDRWNAWAPWEINGDLQQLVAGQVGIYHCEGCTRRVPVEAPQPDRPGRRITGFTGQVTFALLSPDVTADQRARLAALARYATFCGTGVETLRGLGQTRFLAAEAGRGAHRAEPA